MNTATQHTQALEAEVMQFWASQARLQRTAFDAIADYLGGADNAPLAPTQDRPDPLSHQHRSH